jgi:xylan 1,4-beta-xylosidase
MQTFHNPILPGFYPDPSACRVGDDYYLVTSSFEYFPGLPIFHSRDLVHWRQIGHVLNRPSQLNLDGIMPSRGLWAPTIRFHQGKFYVVNTIVNNAKEMANFIVTATNPAGPWSEPFWLEDAPGIDPSLFFDDDGRGWYCGNRIPPTGEQYVGHREIWLQELDLNAMQLIGPKYSLWDGALKESRHAEAPHIYKIRGQYYLLIAEGGTSHGHSITIARSEKITGLYAGNRYNPILTHRHLGLDYPIVGTGHAELIETQNGEWWMVLLAMRPYGGYYYNLGRETFLVPVKWESAEGDWPIVAPGVGRVEFEQTAPGLTEHCWDNPPACDHFETRALDLRWNFLRTPREEWYTLGERASYLRIRLRPPMLSEWANPSFIGRRQQHIDWSVRAAMEFVPANENECAGIVLLQNHDYHFRFVVTTNGAGPVVHLIKRENGAETIIAEKTLAARRFYFKVQAHGQAHSFYIATESENWQTVAEQVDGRMLSTPVAGGFTGVYVGMYASSNGTASHNVADFDWFEYAPFFY